MLMAQPSSQSEDSSAGEGQASNEASKSTAKSSKDTTENGIYNIFMKIYNICICICKFRLYCLFLLCMQLLLNRSMDLIKIKLTVS